MKVLGLRYARFKEWLEVLKEERKNVGLTQLWAMLVGALWATSKPDRRGYRRRMRICAKCPIYDRELHRCRPFTGAPVGCGCYMPYKAQGPGPCWLRERGHPGGW